MGLSSAKLFRTGYGRGACHLRRNLWLWRDMKWARCFWVTMLMMKIATVVAWAHDPGLSTSRVEVTADELRFEVAFAPSDILAILPEVERNEPFAKIQAALERRVAVFYALFRDGQRIPGPSTLTSVFNVGDNITFRFEIARGTGARWEVDVEGLSHLPGRHRHYMSVVTDGGVLLAEKLFQPGDVVLQLLISDPVLSPRASTSSSVVAESPAAATPQEEFKRSRTFWAFFKLGVEHLVVGFDHLLFLFGLLLVCARWKQMLGIITSFTVGHSLTLILATLQVVEIQGLWVEVIIAASIVYVGVENLLQRGQPPAKRWVVTFLFGLIHGMGFASVLRDLGVGETAGGLAMPLIGFNLGVEVGQIGIAAVALPLLWWARKNARFVRVAVPLLSGAVVLAGLYWLIERAFFAS